MATGPTSCPSCGIDLEPGPGGGVADDCPGCGEGRLFRVVAEGGVKVLYLRARGLVTEQNVMRGLEGVRRLIADRGSDRVLVDFQGVTYLSSTILARLINLARLARDAGADLKLSGIRPDVQDVFRIARLEGFFAMYPDRDTALAAY